ncbi:hypothetical protein V8Z80_11860 [Orrella sp. JC864]
MAEAVRQAAEAVKQAREETAAATAYTGAPYGSDPQGAVQDRVQQDLSAEAARVAESERQAQATPAQSIEATATHRNLARGDQTKRPGNQ